jgi:hypothetical protein
VVGGSKAGGAVVLVVDRILKLQVATISIFSSIAIGEMITPSTLGFGFPWDASIKRFVLIFQYLAIHILWGIPRFMFSDEPSIR